MKTLEQIREDWAAGDVRLAVGELLDYLIAKQQEAQPELKGKERLALGADLLVFAGIKSALDRIATAIEALPTRRDWAAFAMMNAAESNTETFGGNQPHMAQVNINRSDALLAELDRDKEAQESEQDACAKEIEKEN